MGLLPDWMIERDVKIEPFAPQQHRPGIISYGVTSYGYDVRVGRSFKVFTNVYGSTVDPKKFDPKSFVDIEADECVIPPNSFALAETVEYFDVPREKLARLAPVYAGDPATHRFAEVKTSPNPIGLPLVPPTAPPRLDAGGAGLFSTLMDYARFAQMLGNGGALDGVRILAPATVEMMRTNMISWKALEAGISRPPVHFDTAIGFGLDAQVMLDPRAAGSLVGKNTMSW